MKTLVLATHASYHLPARLESNLLLDERLTKNFSDYATKELVRDVEQKVVCSFSRAIGDPNRARDAKDVFRTTDFHNNPVWNTPLTKKEQETLLQTHYDEYHKEVREKIRELKPRLIMDVHDTGELLLGTNPQEDVKRPGGFPKLCISDYNHTTCDEETTKHIAMIFREELGIEVTINDPYQGGYVTRTYAKEGLQTIQLEFNRTLYMDEKTQTINKDSMNKIREGFMRALTRIKKL